MNNCGFTQSHSNEVEMAVLDTQDEKKKNLFSSSQWHDHCVYKEIVMSELSISQLKQQLIDTRWSTSRGQRSIPCRTKHSWHISMKRRPQPEMEALILHMNTKVRNPTQHSKYVPTISSKCAQRPAPSLIDSKHRPNDSIANSTDHCPTKGSVKVKLFF